MLVTCMFYGLRHHAATVEFEVEQERLAIGAVFAFAGEDYVILSAVAGDGTDAANVDLEQRYRTSTAPRLRPLSAGERAGPPPPQASTAQARQDAVASELQRLQHMDADALARLSQLLQQFERLQPGIAQLFVVGARLVQVRNLRADWFSERRRSERRGGDAWRRGFSVDRNGPR